MGRTEKMLSESIKLLYLLAPIRNANSGFFGWVSEVMPLRKFSVTFFLVTVVDQMVLGTASCPTKVYCTAIFYPANSHG